MKTRIFVHKRVMVKPGHWKYHGYEIEKDEKTKKWLVTKPANIHPNSKVLIPKPSLCEVCEVIWVEYARLLYTVDKLEGKW